MPGAETEDEEDRRVTVRADPELVDRVDRVLMQAKMNGTLPMSYSRSDAIRDMLRQLANDPEKLSDWRECG